MPPTAFARSCAAMADVPRQLAVLLGKKAVCRIRKSDESPPRISAIDVVTAITGQTGANANHYFERLKVSRPPKFVLCVQTSKSVSPKFVRFVQTSRSATPKLVRLSIACFMGR